MSLFGDERTRLTDPTQVGCQSRVGAMGQGAPTVSQRYVGPYPNVKHGSSWDSASNRSEVLVHWPGLIVPLRE